MRPSSLLLLWVAVSGLWVASCDGADGPPDPAAQADPALAAFARGRVGLAEARRAQRNTMLLFAATW